MANNSIQVFQSPQFGQVRTAGTGDNPQFCLADICRVLDLQSSAVMRRLQDDVITSHPITDSLGREQVANFVNEDGLYDVILDSRKPEAKQFRKWVTGEVLRFYDEDIPFKVVFAFVEGVFMPVYTNKPHVRSSWPVEDMEIAGNIFDNPELLEGGAE